MLLCADTTTPSSNHPCRTPATCATTGGCHVDAPSPLPPCINQLDARDLQAERGPSSESHSFPGTLRHVHSDAGVPLVAVRLVQCVGKLQCERVLALQDSRRQCSTRRRSENYQIPTCIAWTQRQEICLSIDGRIILPCKEPV